MRAIDFKLRDISDEETRQLFAELRQVTGVDPAHYADFSAYQFLQPFCFGRRSARWEMDSTACFVA
jgi:hypothetical protein